MTDRLGGYWLGDRLGDGGREVEAYDESGTRYALRILDEPEAGGPLAAGAGAGVEAAMRVRSLSVARLIDARLDAAPPYLVSEYVEGPTLRQVVDRHGHLAADDLYRLAAAMATALASVHEAGAVHGRLTPDRVVLGAEGPRLVGLGLAPADHVPADDVQAWGRVLAFAAHDRLAGRERLDRLLRELVTAAIKPDPEHRPDARRLLMALLDAPPSQQGRLLPPEPIDDPPLGARAETLYLQLSRADQDLVPEVFLRLVDLDPDGTDTVRAAAGEDLVAGRSADEAAAIERVLESYGKGGLLLVTDERVTITPAALLRAWPRLHEWLEAERDGLAVHRELARAAREWESGGRRESDLFRDELLDRTLAWAASARRHVTLSASEQSFVDAGLAGARRRARRRRRTITAALASVAAIAVLVAFLQHSAADGRLDLAMAKVAASRAEALRLSDPVTARKLGLAAWSLARTPEAQRVLTAAASDPAVSVFADPHAGPRSLHAISLDGQRLAALTDGRLRVYDVRSREIVAQASEPEQSIRAMAWSPDGETLALVGVDRSYLWDTGSAAVGPPFGRGLGLSTPGQSAWFSPGGGLLFAAAPQSGERWAWDLRARRAVFAGEHVVVGPRDEVSLVFAGKRSEIRRDGATTPAPWLDRMPWEYTTFTPSGRVAIAEETGIQIYDLDGVPTLPARLRPSPGILRFSADGLLMAATDADRVRVWLATDGTLLLDRQVPAAGVDRPAVAVPVHGGRWLHVLSDRGTVITIDLAHAAPKDLGRAVAGVCEKYGGLSPEEWGRHLPELQYRPTCPTT
ncbi:hypothetical protein HII36_26025 [Nonomuraea sp. NN258]|uniref:nSTAND1 domain-containing NTPase n=1 Tax=Nonomuraea antri TaxID=2730852 RepID=UPI00156A31A9|nr:hypothetical protein [Nonomuraea antri]NRQ35257.1 hypothetical protein [Nonomuraea antri]